MRELNRDTVCLEIEYINKVLKGKKRGFKRIALEDYNKTDKELLEELEVLGYIKIKVQSYYQFVRAIDITNSNIEVIEPGRQEAEPVNEVLEVATVETKAITNFNEEKLNLLLDNLDHLLKLIPKENSVFRSNDNRVVSIRLDSGLYNEAKHRAESSNITVTELFNRALENYLR